MYHIEQKYDEEQKGKILELISKYYLGNIPKNSLLSKLEKHNLNDKVINKILKEIINSENNPNCETYYIKENEKLCGLVSIYKEKTYISPEALINIIELEIDDETEKDKILTLIINDIIDKWKPDRITTIAEDSDEYNMLRNNGFDEYIIGKNKYMMCKEVRERKYVRKRSNNSK